MNKIIEKRISRNLLRAHIDGTFSYRIAGHWTHHVGELPQSAYLTLIRTDHRISEKIVMREFETGRPCVAGSRVIVRCKEATTT
jgi:hypothetical protein